jgi:hypothetical protein
MSDSIQWNRLVEEWAHKPRIRLHQGEESREQTEALSVDHHVWSAAIADGLLSLSPGLILPRLAAL